MCYRDELSALPYHCQGICSHLKTCQACLLQGQGVKLTTASPRRRFYQVECSWCVKNSTCQQKAVPEGSCQRADNTASGIIGWWNSSSPSWTDIAQCSLAEVPGGIQKASFYHPRNNSQPDEVEFVGELSATGIKVPIHYLQSQEGDPLDACSNYTNCMACMMDASCGWGPSNSQCVRKAANQTASTGWCGPDLDKLLITHPKDCYTCPDYTDCTDCSQDPLCEWKRLDEQCHRRGRFAFNTVTDPSQCREPCDEKKNCSSCISERNECFWCETTKTCFPFNHYSSHFIHGKCQDWVDFEGKQTHYCLDCSSLPNCTACLERFGCGWCGDYNNPKIGKCVGGGFPGPSDGSCDSIMSSHILVTNQTFSGHTNWTYHQCLDADECRLGLHKCHEKAECINTEGPEDSYECLCEQGYMGNGTHCRETCYHNCVNGTCSGAPNYQCVCNLGWTGLDCGTDCGCNFHSTCQNGVGICDKCQDSTDGQFCEKCQFGYYGNPKEGKPNFAIYTQLETYCKFSDPQPQRCHKCSCNQHGDASKGICNNVTGECYCTGNTEGLVCQHCSPGHYGSPVNGGKCYRACQGRLVLEQAEGSLGVQLPVSATSNKNLHCLWIIHAPDTAKPSDGFTVTVDGIATRCRENHLMVFDGVPPFISGNTTESRLLGTFCGQAQNLEPIRTDTDTVTVYFEMDMDNKDIYVEQKGFNLSYVINLCPRCKENEICVGNQCKQDPNRSSASKFYNVCPTSCDTKSHGTCVCINDLDMMVFPWNFLEPISKRKPGSIPGRYGHSVTSCGENFFYVFGGYSQEHGALNDIWKYTTSTYRWTQEQPITSDQPDGRYFHQAVCSPVSQEIYVYGGIVKNKAGAFEATNEFWKFSTGARVWTRLDVPEDFNPVAGHTMTLVKERYLVVIGGISSKRYFSSLCGHSAVYDPDTDMIYIHGGMAFKQFKFDVSNDTFMYDTEKKQAYLVHVQGPEQAIPRVFHVAVRALEGMLVIGGMGNLGQTTEHMSLFRFNCSTWHKYLSKKPTSETYRSRTNSLIAASSIRLKDRVYVVGGYDGTTYSEVVVISPKETFCQTAGTQMDCLQTTGCDFCVAEGIGKCVEKASDSTCSGGQACDVSWINQTVCSTYQTCQTCEDNFPIVDTRFSSTWRCAKNAVGGVCTNHSVCPKRCDEYSDCESCQRASGTGAGSSGCVWSSIKQQCFDKALIKLYCVGGECGVILEGKPHKCPVPCSQYQICAECIKAPWCGWCAFAGYIGEGICMQGGRDNPTGVGSCLENDIKQSEGYRPINLWTKKSKGAPIWAYTSCPPENECVNTHHDCDNESQDCTDTETSYNCTCKIGYLEDAVRYDVQYL
uniref:Multiple epidermal growth factor-like domains 8 n=1 Tax=Magallana gigas TaxID=29159 RepID=K1QU64_MAGGI